MPDWLHLEYLALPYFLRTYIESSYISLPFFYVLSGFVLYYNYDKIDFSEPKNRRFFWIKRFARLAPVFYLSLPLGAYLLYCNKIKQVGAVYSLVGSLKNLLINAVFLGAWIPESLNLNFPSWSNSAEMFYYFLFPFLVPMVCRFSKTSAAWGLFLSFAFGAMIQCLGVWMFPDISRWPKELVHVPMETVNFFRLNPLAHLNEFLFGLCLSRLFSFFPEGNAHFRRNELWFVCSLVFILFSLPLLTFLPYLMLISFFLLPWIAFVIWFGARPRSGAGAWLEKPFFLLLGEASYALYILHIPLKSMFTLVTGHWFPDFPQKYLIIPFLLLAPGFACLVHLYFENPARKAWTRFLEKTLNH